MGTPAAGKAVAGGSRPVAAEGRRPEAAPGGTPPVAAVAAAAGRTPAVGGRQPMDLQQVGAAGLLEGSQPAGPGEGRQLLGRGCSLLFIERQELIKKC